MVLILDSTAGNPSSLPSQCRKVLGGMDRSRGSGGIRPKWSPYASSLRLLNASRVSSTLDERFFGSIGWSCSLRVLWFLNGKSLRFPDFCISVPVFDQLCERARCCVQVAFFHPFSLSTVRKIVPQGHHGSYITMVLQREILSPCILFSGFIF